MTGPIGLSSKLYSPALPQSLIRLWQKYDPLAEMQPVSENKLIERKYHIIIISVFEQMFIDYDSPYFLSEADMLVTAEFELHVIRDRTKFGIHGR